MASAAFWKDTFKNIGRLTMMRNVVAGDLPTVHSGVVISLQEFSNEDFDLVSTIVPTFVNNMTTLGTNLTSAQTQVETSLTQYITGPLKTDMNAENDPTTVAPGTTASGIINSLITQMEADAVYISGAAASGDTGLFGNMFKEVFGRNDFPYYNEGAPAASTLIWDGYASFDWQEWDGH